MSQPPLWAPWRIDYILTKPRSEGCVFCELAKPDSGTASGDHVLGEASLAYVAMNRYPYAPGHLLVIPRRHEGELAGLTRPEADQCTHLMQLCTALLQGVLGADGINLGMNLGTAAGAGIPGHVHWHLVPRWAGDTNFMAVIGDQRVIAEQLEATWRKLQEPFRMALEAAGLVEGAVSEVSPS